MISCGKKIKITKGHISLQHLVVSSNSLERKIILKRKTKFSSIIRIIEENYYLIFFLYPKGGINNYPTITHFTIHLPLAAPIQSMFVEETDETRASVIFEL